MRGVTITDRDQDSGVLSFELRDDLFSTGANCARLMRGADIPERAAVVVQAIFPLARALLLGPGMNKTKTETKTKKTLRLNPETIRTLDPAELAIAAGGLVRRDSDCDTCAERGC